MEKYEWLEEANENYKDTVALLRKAYREKNREEVFKCCHRLCHATMLKMLRKRKVVRDDVDELILDATCKVVDQIWRLKLYDNPATQCYFSVLYTLGNPKQLFEDKIITFSELESLEEEENVPIEERLSRTSESTF